MPFYKLIKIQKDGGYFQIVLRLKVCQLSHTPHTYALTHPLLLSFHQLVQRLELFSKTTNLRLSEAFYTTTSLLSQCSRIFCKEYLDFWSAHFADFSQNTEGIFSYIIRSHLIKLTSKFKRVLRRQTFVFFLTLHERAFLVAW
jgi:hypothetical protein